MPAANGPKAPRSDAAARQAFARNGESRAADSPAPSTGRQAQPGLSGGGESTTVRVYTLFLRYLPPTRSKCPIGRAVGVEEPKANALALTCGPGAKRRGRQVQRRVSRPFLPPSK